MISAFSVVTDNPKPCSFRDWDTQRSTEWVLIRGWFVNSVTLHLSERGASVRGWSQGTTARHTSEGPHMQKWGCTRSIPRAERQTAALCGLPERCSSMAAGLPWAQCHRNPSPSLILHSLLSLSSSPSSSVDISGVITSPSSPPPTKWLRRLIYGYCAPWAGLPGYPHTGIRTCSAHTPVALVRTHLGTHKPGVLLPGVFGARRWVSRCPVLPLNHTWKFLPQTKSRHGWVCRVATRY